MEDAHQEITDKLDRELNRYIAQYAALFMLNEELDMLMRSESLKEETVDCQTVTSWLARLQEMVQDAMQQPHGEQQPEPGPAPSETPLAKRDGEEFRLSAGTA